MSTKPTSVAVLDIGDCRTDSARRLAGKFAARRLGGQAIVDRIARRLSDSTRLDRVVVTGTNLPSNIVAGIGVDVLDLPHEHVCERLAAAGDFVNAEWVVYVPGNRPFIDPVLIDCLLTRAQLLGEECDYVGFCGNDGNWERVCHLGVAGEVCHTDALRRLRRNVDRLSKSPEELSLAGWLTKAPGTFNLKFVSIPEALDCHDLRFSLESESDWELAELLSDHLGYELTEWQVLTNLVRDNQSLREVMAEPNTFSQK